MFATTGMEWWMVAWVPPKARTWMPPTVTWAPGWIGSTRERATAGSSSCRVWTTVCGAYTCRVGFAVTASATTSGSTWSGCSWVISTACCCSNAPSRSEKPPGSTRIDPSMVDTSTHE